jgi:hypothetical protein
MHYSELTSFLSVKLEVTSLNQSSLEYTIPDLKCLKLAVQTI